MKTSPKKELKLDELVYNVCNSYATNNMVCTWLKNGQEKWKTTFGSFHEHPTGIEGVFVQIGRRRSSDRIGGKRRVERQIEQAGLDLVEAATSNLMGQPNRAS
jgi:hypothetical protein